MENNMIMTEGQEIENKGLCEIAAEIKTITNQMRVTLISGIIEIGKRFEQAKELTTPGKWGEFCENVTGYSQSMAEKYIKIYHEYGSEQYSLFGDLSKSESMQNLGVTKLIALTAIPADEREAFVEDNNITEETTVKELQAKIRELTQAAEDSANDYELALEELKEELDAAKSDLAAREKEAEELRAQLSSPAADETDMSDAMQEMIENARAAAAESLKKDIDKAEKNRQKAEDRLKKLQDKFDKLKSESEEKDSKITAQKEIAEAERVKNTELQAEIEKLKKTSDLSAREGMVKLNLCFENAQDNIKKISEIFNQLPEDGKDKIRGGIVTVLSDLIGEI